MSNNLTIGLVGAGILGILLYASSKKANGSPRPTPEPSPAPPQDGTQRQSGHLCCPGGELLVGSICKKYDGQGNYVYSGPAQICIDKEQGTISRLFGMNGSKKTNDQLFAVRW